MAGDGKTLRFLGKFESPVCYTAEPECLGCLYYGFWPVDDERGLENFVKSNFIMSFMKFFISFLSYSFCGLIMFLFSKYIRNSLRFWMIISLFSAEAWLSSLKVPGVAVSPALAGLSLMYYRI